MNERRAAILFLLPALAVILLFFLLPVCASLLLSITDFDLYALADIHNIRLVALRNYSELLGSALFWKALVNTLYFTAVGGPLTVIVALASALLVNAKVARWRTLFRTIYFAPVVTTIVAVAVVWKYLYHPRFGLLNRGLDLIGIGPIDWLGDPKWAMPAIIILAVWKNFGYTMIIFVAALQAIPEELYEAARIDGASALQQFRYVTLPMLGPTFVFVGIITAIGYLQFFPEPYVMTRGGPVNSTLSVVMLMYEQGFKWWNMGYAAAVAFVLFIFIAAATLVQLKVQRASK
ncbi:MAG: sugar ABC transporter permease [Acidobacteriota bacterium]|nr:sugar ABC transporter permease [Acidobacteriota bacterium]